MTHATTQAHPSQSAPDVDGHYPIDESQMRQFREDGFIKLKNVMSAEALEYYGSEITRLTLELNPRKNTPVETRDTYGKAFIQVGNLWQKHPVIQAFSFSRRLARIATELMGTTGVRMWHDQALYKEAGGGFTPWHVDQQYWPMSSGLCVTAWVPLQAVPMELGPLCFGKGSHLKNIGRELSISDESERLIRDAIKAQGVLEVFEPYDLGEVSFHLGWTLHRAGPNTTTEARKVHTIIYMDQDMTLGNPKNVNQENDWKAWSPSSKIGQVMADKLNPVLYSARS